MIDYLKNKFDKYYNEAIIEVLAFKNDCNMTIKDIQKETGYEIEFINHVIENYDVNKGEEKYISVKITKNNIDIAKLKEIGYDDALIADILNPEEEGTSYYLSK